LPEAYIAPPELRDLRELLRHRAVLTRMRTAVKDRVHALLARQACPSTQPCSARPAGSCSPIGAARRLARRRDGLMSLIADCDREITPTTREIDARAKTDDRVKVLCQIPGIGRYTAMPIIAEVGAVTRCPTARHRCAWAGLAPTVRSSDGNARLGHISRQGSPALRWALTKAAQQIPTGGGPLRATFEPIATRRGRKIAQVAVARQILTLCSYGLRDGEIRGLNHQPDTDDHDQRAGAA
jgi:transposase